MVTNGNAPNSAAVARGTAKALRRESCNSLEIRWFSPTTSRQSAREHPDRSHIAQATASSKATCSAWAALSPGIRCRISSRFNRLAVNGTPANPLPSTSARTPEIMPPARTDELICAITPDSPSHGHYGRHHRHRSFALLAAPSKRPATGHGREGHTATASMPARPSARRIAATHPRSYVSPHMPHSHDPSHMPHRPVKSCQRGHGIMAPSPSHNATTSPDNTPSRMPRHPIWAILRRP